MKTINLKALFLLALAGAIVATPCDANHAFTRTLSYPDPAIGLQAIWVFPGFVLAFLLMAINYWQMAPLAGRVMAVDASTSPGTLAAMVESLSAFAMVYLASGFGNEYPALLSLIFYGLFLLRWAVSYERAWLLCVALVLAVGGMLGEGLLSDFGLVAYRHQDIYFVPWWLGGLYMHGAIALRDSMRFFLYR